MKKLYVLLFVLLLISSVAVYADEQETSPGMTPDSFLWGVDVAFDKISLALTADDAKRAQKALGVAQERLAEIQTMAQEDHVDRAQKAQREHAKLMERLERDITKLSEQSDEETFQEGLGLETRLAAHRNNVDSFRLRVEGELSVQQQAALDALIASLGDDVAGVEIRIREKNDETRVRLKQRLSDDQINELEGDNYMHLADVAQAQAQREIARAERKLAEFEAKYQDKVADAAGDERPSRIAREAVDNDEETVSGEVRVRMRIPDSDVEDMEVEEADSVDDSRVQNRITGRVTQVVDDAFVDVAVEEVASEVDDSVGVDSVEDSVDDNILREFGLVLPVYAQRGMHISQLFIDQAKDALQTSFDKEAEGEYRAAYAYAKFSKRLANSAMKGKYLHLTDAQEDELDARKSAREVEEDRLDDFEDNLKDAECLADADCDRDEYCSDDFECEDLDEEDEEEIECLADADCDGDEFCDSGECEDLDDDSDSDEDLDDDSDSADEEDED